MSFEPIFNLAIWIGFVFGWVPYMHWKHLKRRRAFRAINKGRRFSEKYRLLKRIS